MKNVDLTFDCEVTDENLEIDVEVNYRCFFTDHYALYPMCVSGSIYKGRTLSQFKQEGYDRYCKDYQKVEIVDVLIDLPELTNDHEQD